MKKLFGKRMIILASVLCLVLGGCGADAPVDTSGPANTEESQEGVTTSEPEVTEEPIVTEEPVVTGEPVATEEPVVTEEPVATEQPTTELEITEESTPKEIIQIIYEECRQIYGKLNSSFYVGSDNLAGKGISIDNYGDNWYEVQEEGFTTIQDIKNYVEEVFTPELAQVMFYSNLFEGESPSMIESEGKLYTQLYDGPGLWNLSEITLTYYDAENIHANMALYDDLLEITEYMHMELICEEGIWYVAKLSHIMNKTGPYDTEAAFMEALATDMVIAPDQTIIPLSMGSTVSVDLDGDGENELVQTTIATIGAEHLQYNAMRNVLPTIRIDDYIFDEEYMLEMLALFLDNPDMATWYIFDVDVTDGYKEIGLYEAGPSGDPCTTLLRYEGGRLRKIGSFTDNPIGDEVTAYSFDEEVDYQDLVNSVDRSQICIKVAGDGTIYARQRIDVMETNFAEGLWKLQSADSFGQAQLELQVREVYEITSFGRLNEEYFPTVKNELQVFMEPDLESEIITLSQGEGVDLYRYYPEGSWVQIAYDNYESYGWLHITGYDGIYQVNENGEGEYFRGYSLIENLSYAD